MESRYSFVTESAIMTAAPAVAKWTRDPDRSRSNSGPEREGEIASGLLERGIYDNPGHAQPAVVPKTAPTASQVSMQWGVASLKPTSSEYGRYSRRWPRGLGR